MPGMQACVEVPVAVEIVRELRKRKQVRTVLRHLVGGMLQTSSCGSSW